MKLVYAFLATAAVCAATLPAFADTNLALGATVTTNGPGWGNSSGWCCGSFNPSSIVNGTPQADGTQWNEGTAFWSGGVPDTADTLTITLANTASVDEIVLQADDNDAYQVNYWNGTAWTDLTTFSAVGGWGLATRPELFLGAPVTTDAFQITAVGGDGDYAVGQFEALGTAATPEPATYTMILTGLGVLGAMVRRRRIV
jgi:hypothetical protein